MKNKGKLNTKRQYQEEEEPIETSKNNDKNIIILGSTKNKFSIRKNQKEKNYSAKNIFIILMIIILIIGCIIFGRIIWNLKEYELKKYFEDKAKTLSEWEKNYNDDLRKYLDKKNYFDKEQESFEERKINIIEEETKLLDEQKKFNYDKEMIQQKEFLLELKEKNLKEKVEQLKNELINLELEEKQNEIHITYSVNNHNPLPVLVSMTSSCDNAKKNTLIFFHVLVSFKEIEETSKEKLKSIEKHYERCKIKFTNVDEKFGFLEPNFPLKYQYYKLALSSLLPNLSRVIHLDEDVLVFDNLEEMYNLNMNDSIVLGHIDPYKYKEWFQKDYNITTKFEVSVGVTLWDLDLLRKNRLEEQFLSYLREKKGKEISLKEQGIINYFCREKISPLPPKFGIFGWLSYLDIMENYFKNFPQGEAYYDINQYMEAYANPSISHITYPRSWETNKLNPHGVIFYKYLIKTDYYNEHLENYLNIINKQREEEKKKKEEEERKKKDEEEKKKREEEERKKKDEEEKKKEGEEKKKEDEQKKKEDEQKKKKEEKKKEDEQKKKEEEEKKK